MASCVDKAVSQRRAAAAQNGTQVTNGAVGRVVPRMSLNEAGALQGEWYAQVVVEGMLSWGGKVPPQTYLPIGERFMKETGFLKKAKDPLTADESAALWTAIERLAIELDSLGVLPSKAKMFVESVAESVEELPDTVGNAVSFGGKWLAIGVAVVALVVLLQVTRG